MTLFPAERRLSAILADIVRYLRALLVMTPAKTSGGATAIGAA